MDTINPLSLRFRPTMERKFLDDYFARSLIPARLGLVVGLLIYTFFGIWDGLVGEEARSTLWLIRFGIGAPWFVIVFMLSFSRHFKRWMQPLMCTVMLVTGLSLMAMLAVSPAKLRADSYYPGLMLIVFFSCTSMKIRFWYALGSVLLLLFAYQTVARDFADISFSVLGHNLFFLGGAGSIGLVVCYAMERSIRGDFQLEHRNAALLQELREQKEVAERANLTKSKFLAAASHDMRQPLHAIALFGEVLDMALHGRPEHVHTSRLMSAVTVLAASLDAMLDISQLDAGVINPKIETIALNPLLETLNQMFAASAEEKGLQLHVRASALWTQSDVQLLQRLLANLIENAMKFTPRGGVIVRAHARGEHIHIDVRDTGVGIAAENIDYIFDEFYQVGNAGRDRSKGLGIGLALVQRIARLLGHTVQVRSRLGSGSRFRVTLPNLAPPDALAERVVAAPQGRPTPLNLPKRVLVIDDEDNIRPAISELLRLHGIQVSAVSNEAQAQLALQQAAATSLPFDVLLCDYRLHGGADGLEAALRLRQTFAPALPLLIITGETAPDKLQRIHDLNIPVIFKPTSAAVLLHALAELMKGD